MHASSASIATAYTLSLAFAVAGAVQLSGTDAIQRAYVRWGYPARASRIAGALELLAAALLAMSAARPIGVALAAMVNFVAVVVLLKNRAYLLALPGLAVTVALPFTLLQNT